MSERLRIIHEGSEYDPFKPGERWATLMQTWSEGEASHYRRVATEGAYVLEGVEVAPSTAKRIRASLLGTYASMPGVFDPTSLGGGRELVPGLWRWGSIPMLGGSPKVGKSTLVAELVAALIIPGRKFLDYFAPVELTEEERGRDVLLINAENPPGDLHEALLDTGLEFNPGFDGPPFYSYEGGGALVVEHLEELGGPSVFDLTNEANYDWWASRLMQCPCDGVHDAQPPLAVIADGVTAMMNTDTDRYGEWYAAFRRLMSELDVPNALGVAHNGLAGKHLMGGVKSMAGSDGNWTYAKANPDASNSPRYFWTDPRMRGPKVPKSRIVVEDGRLVMKRRASDGPGSAAVEVEPEEAGTDWEADVLDRLSKGHPAGMMTTDLTGRGRYGKNRRAALDRLEKAGKVIAKPSGIGQRWSLPIVE